jgi:uncharacterized cupin superfamily protein
MSKQSHSQVVNVDEVSSIELSYGQRYQLTRKQLGLAAGARKLGCTLVELPPGTNRIGFFAAPRQVETESSGFSKDLCLLMRA